LKQISRTRQIPAGYGTEYFVDTITVPHLIRVKFADFIHLYTRFIHKLLPLFIVFSSWMGTVMAQANSVNYDYNYSPDIRSVVWTPAGRLTFPVLYLNSDQPLQMTFDDLTGDFKYYKYRIVQCDANWQPSSLSELEYIDGLNDIEIRQYAYSVNTRQNYTRYQFSFPNADISLTKSGNYLVHVYREDDNELILTRRFIVAEMNFALKAEFELLQGIFDKQTEQKIKCSASSDASYTDPYNQVKLLVLQNGNWFSGEMLPPRTVVGSTLSFDYPDKPVFKGLKEFRALDTRSLRHPKFMIENLERYNDGTQVFLRTDVPRAGKMNLSYPDLNGNFIFENFDNPLDTMNIDYVNVHFYFKSPKLTNDVFVVGAFNNWGRAAGTTAMKYDATRGYYEGEILMKQGYYDYMFAESKNGKLDFTNTEGSSYETANNYQCILYYRKFGDRYDRIVAYQQIGLPISGDVQRDE
jgi:hypothetical protein